MAYQSVPTAMAAPAVLPHVKYIRIKILEARNLIPMDLNGLSDPFVVVHFNGGDSSHRKRHSKTDSKTTDIEYKTLNPVWKTNNEFVFRVDNAATDFLKLVVWDWDKVGLNDYEGEITVAVALASHKPNEPHDLWLPLVGKKGKDKARGDIHIVLTFLDGDTSAATASQAAPLAAEWLIPFSELTLAKELGRGAFGVVYKGKWRLQDCAIKVLPQERMGPSELAEFQAECQLMSSIRPHRNLVTFLGVSMDAGQPLCLVTDFIDGGALDKKILDPSFTFDWPGILKIAKGICAGMHHLHEEGLLHRDLAARNVLLSASYEAMVADFGLSKKVDKLHQSGRDNVVQEGGFFRGPYKWMAPESLQANVFSKKTDVWGYGVTLWEVLSRSSPFPEYDIYKAAELVCKEGLRLPMAPTWPPRWVALLQSCWNVNPEARPSFPDIMARLDEIEEEMKQFGALAAK